MNDLHQTVEIAVNAGKLLIDYASRIDRVQVDCKSGTRDLVTAADLASEKYIIEQLSKHFPQSSFWSEETHSQDDGAKVQWCIDPLDGTVNFVQGLPMYAVSIARLVDKEVNLAVVYIPELGQCFSASAEQQTQLNGSDVFVGNKESLDEAVLATGFPYRRHVLNDNNLENFNRLFLNQRGIRRMGAAAVDLAYVACSRLDAFWELHLSPWDVAAGAYLVQRAGGTVDTIVSGGDWLAGRNIVAGNSGLVSSLQQQLLVGRDNSYPDLGESG
jgi:myo-inositol-1(or 4)-monophosphatase